jgi:hypothetical protein
MSPPQDIDYTVLLIFAGFGTERDNAEAILESALDWLNTHKDRPGFRFAAEVGAHLEIVQDADEARARITADDTVAMAFLHDVPDDERDALARDCRRRHIPVCVTVDAPRRSGRRKGPLRIVFRKRPTAGPPAHQLAAGTLTDPIRDDEDMEGRVGEAIAVLALGVMEHHWEVHP